MFIVDLHYVYHPHECTNNYEVSGVAIVCCGYAYLLSVHGTLELSEIRLWIYSPQENGLVLVHARIGE
jgi:hypothetical protein